MGTKMKINKNTICYTSEIGHNNFWYPSENKVLVKENCDVEQVSWISGGTKFAIKILKSFLIPIDITENTTANLSPPSKNNYTIVWVDKCSQK
jgi:hypothetical protein|tara:strand:- start:2286 stop:2564 length:279 start_codon:yes stop_codon:yes gene_type:complete